MTEINWLDKVYLWNLVDLNNFFIWIFFVIIFFIWFYFLNKKEKISSEKIEKKIFVEPKNFFEDLKKIEKNFLNSSENIFYWKISFLLKEFLEEKKWENFSKMTFSQISKLEISEDLKNILSQIYFKSYAKKIEDSEEKRIEVIWEIKKIIS